MIGLKNAPDSVNCATNTRTFIAAAEKSSIPPQVRFIVN